MQAVNTGMINECLRLPQNGLMQPQASFPQKFANLYWNIAENKPSTALSELFSLLLPSLPATPTLEEAVKETQSQWLQKMRWDVKQDSVFIQEKRQRILPLLQTLGMTSSFCPQGHFDTALLLGARANVFIARCYALCSAVKNGDMTLSQIEILAGAQPLHPLELKILKESSLQISEATTEAEMALIVSEKLLRPLGINCNIITTDLKERKPTTEQTVNSWLDLSDRTGQLAVIVSDPQFAVYQHFQCMEALYKRNITEVKFDLLSTQLEPKVFEELSISLEEAQENPILLYLDTIARTLYTLQNQIKNGSLT
jgi:hypothetical protein